LHVGRFTVSLTETIKQSRRKAQLAAAQKDKRKRKQRRARKSTQPQHAWLRANGSSPTPESLLPPPVPGPVGKAQRSQGPPCLMAKAEVCAVVGCTYPTLWSWMQRGVFPRSRVVGGKSMWLSTEIEQWLAELPRRKLKGDA
jgi:predicted DNA-binding transcriptional regulator AlpA